MTLNAISNSAYIAIQAYMSSASSNTPTDNNYAVNYQTNSTATAAVIDSYTANVPANTTPFGPVSVSLLSIFPNDTSPIFLAVFDTTLVGQPFYVGTSSGTGMIQVSAGGVYAVTCTGTLPSTIYLANPSTTLASVIKIVVMSN